MRVVLKRFVEIENALQKNWFMTFH